jgi:DNA-binding IclR family transcriptional regulator
MPTDDPLFVTALARGLAVLHCCGAAHDPQSVRQIVEETKLPQPTVWRLCHTLVQLGYLERTQENRYRPGLPLLGLGYAAVAQRPLAELARPAMVRLAGAYSGTVSLAVCQGLDMVFLERITGATLVYPGLRLGSRVSLLASATGWAYLCALAPAERDALLELLRQRLAADFDRMHSSLKEALRGFDDHGFVINPGILHPEINAIAVPISGTGSGPVACLYFGGPKSDFSVDFLKTEVAPVLLRLANELGGCSAVQSNS